MGRIRTVKPEFFSHEDLSSLPEISHLFAAGLLCYADDEGYFNANPGLIKAAIFPLREPSVSIYDMLTQLSNIGYLRLGEGTDGRRYGQVVHFAIHQRVNRPTPSKIIDIQIRWESSLNTQLLLIEDSLPERKGKEGNGVVDETDLRYKPFIECLDRYWKYFPNHLGKPLPMDAGAGKNLKDWLRKNPKVDERTWLVWLDNMRNSGDINTAWNVREIISRIHRYSDGPLDKYGKPKEVKSSDPMSRMKFINGGAR